MPRPLLLLLALTSFALAQGDPGWSLLNSDFRQQPVSLIALAPDGVRLQPATSANPVVVPLDKFIQIDRASQPRPGDAPFFLLTVTGDRLYGTPVAIKDEQLLWSNPLIGQAAVPLKQLKALVRAGKWHESIERTRNDDLVKLANGDQAAGFLTDFAGGKFKVNVDGTVVELSIDAIDYVHFAAALRQKTPAGPLFRVRLADASLITVPSFRCDAQNATLTIAGAERQAPLAAIAGIEQLNGPVSWLSSRQPEQVVQTPFFSNPAWPEGSRAWPTRMDASVNTARDGTPLPIRYGTRIYARGIGVHAYSRLDFALDGTFKVFRTQYAIAPDDNPRAANVTVRIKLDGKTVHERPNFKADALAEPVLIDLPGDAKLLTLEVDYGLHQDLQDRFNWIEPALLREKPVAPSPVAPATQPATRPRG